MIVKLLVLVMCVTVPVNADEAGAQTLANVSWSQCTSGPWGNLESRPVVYQIADGRLPADLLRAKPTQWVFPATSKQALEQLLEPLFGQATLRKLIDSSSTEITPSGSVVRPSDEIVMAIKAKDRSALYGLLGQSPANESQHIPYVFAETELDRRVQASLLSDKTKQLFRSFVFKLGQSEVFADLDVLLRQTKDPLEQRRIVEVLKQFKSYEVRLRLSEDADVDAVSRYWGQSSDVDGLRSYLSAQTGSDVSVLSLISPFGRARLNTYPERTATRPMVGPDCFWTAANYGRATPDDAFFNPDMVNAFIQREYRGVQTPRHGDIALFIEKTSGTPVHAAIYLAADLMFTKNGYNYWTPWTINKTKELERLYGIHYPVEVKYYRIRN